MRLVSTAALVLALVTAAPARAETQTASRGTVTATLSFRSDDGVYRDLRLTIARSGRLLYDAAPADPSCNDGCWPGRLADGRSIHVRDLDGDGEPEVIADLYTGGAHCCSLARVYAFDGSGYGETTHNFGNAAYRAGDIGGDRRAEFVSSDDRLAYRFTAYAFSVFPVQIWSFANGRFSDVTNRFRSRVRADAARAWRLYREAYRRREYPPRGAAAAWAADEYRLDRRASALHRLRTLARRGELPGGPPRSQARFVGVLDAALRRLGYSSS
jgi:hypothetical protein